MNEVFGLNLEAWERWTRYRKDIRKTYKSQDSIDLAQKKLASFGDMQMQAVTNSIENGWTGLFAPKKERVPFAEQQRAQRNEVQLERLKARALRAGFREPMPDEDAGCYQTLVERAENNAKDQKYRQQLGAKSITQLLAGAK